jgi:ACR3 family arsenite efflux pump ArsB
MEMYLIGKSAILVLVLPFAAAKIMKYLLLKNEKATNAIENIFGKRQFFWLFWAIVAMFASEKIFQSGYGTIFIQILPPLLIFFGITTIIARVTSVILKFPFPDYVSLTFTTLARNSPLALAFAQKAFPEERLILLPLIIGPLFELPILALIAQSLLIYGEKRKN